MWHSISTTGSRSVLALLAGVAICAALPDGANSASTERSGAIEKYGKLPLHFERNCGQTDPGVRYLTRAAGVTIFLTDEEAVLRIANTAIHMRLTGSRRPRRIEGLDALPGTSNYFLGKDPRKWQTGIPHYEKVRYEGVYPGVDLIYYGNGSQLEYDLHVAPGADPGKIAFRFSGMKSMKLDAAGALVLRTDAGDIRFVKPVIHQPDRMVPGGFRLLANGGVGFEIGAYDKRLPLIIDPTLIYSTFLGGSSGSTSPVAIAVDGGGNAYIAGSTYSLDFPLRNPRQPYLGGYSDAFVAKLNPSGSALVYATYLGGTGDESQASIAVDAAGSAYVAGMTASPDFPTRNPSQSVFAGYYDAFLTKLSPDGNALIYSTYLGGSDLDVPLAVAVHNATGNAYLAGYTYSADFPVKSALQPSLKGLDDAFVTKFGPSGGRLFSTFFGGTMWDGAFGIAVDAAGDAYLTGSTDSMDLPVTPGVVQTTLSMPYDGFAAKLAADGSALVWCTYLGGGGDDTGYRIAVDSSGSAYIAGNTTSRDFPITQGAAQMNQAGGYDGFVTKLAPDAKSLVYSTYIGGTRDDFLQCLALQQPGGAVFVTGYSYSYDYPLASALQPQKAAPARLLYRTTSAGAAWSTIDSSLPATGGGFISIDPLHPAKMVFTSNSGVYYSLDGGSNWKPSDLTAFPSALARASSAVLYAANYTEIYRSVNGGVNWQFVTNVPTATGSGIQSLAADPNDPATVYAGSYSDGLYVSVNGGVSWIASNAGLADLNVSAIAVSPSNPSILYAVGFYSGVYKSSDKGANWVQVLSEYYVTDLAVDPGNSAAAYLISGNGMVYATADGGGSWTPRFWEVTATSLAIAPSNTQILYIGTTSGVWQSPDAGLTWAAANTGIEHLIVRDVAVNPSNPSIVYADAQYLGTDAVVTGLMPDGQSFAYSTFLGGTGGASGRAIATDSAGRVYVAGESQSADFPITPGAFQQKLVQQSPGIPIPQGFVARIDDTTAACSVSTNLASKFFYPYGGPQTFSVISPSGCAWSAIPDADWISVTGPNSGTGVGSVSISAAYNSGPARSANLNIGGTAVPITQADSSCYYSVTPYQIDLPVNGGTSSVTVTAPSGCPWTVENSSPSWVKVTSGESGSGNGTVKLSFAPNANVSARWANPMIAGTWINVMEAGEATDVVDLVVSSLKAPLLGLIGGKVNVSARISNIRAQAAPSFRAGFYLSTDPVITTADLFTGSYCNISSLAGWASFDCTRWVTLPPDLAPGKYYLGAIADDLGAAAEGDDTNNARAADTGPTSIPGTCFLSEVLGYSSGTLSMSFNIGTANAATWATWLVSGQGIQQLWSKSLAPIPMVEKVRESKPLANVGNVGVLTSLLDSAQGVVCSDWATVNTGGQGPSVAELENTVRNSGLTIPRKPRP